MEEDVFGTFTTRREAEAAAESTPNIETVLLTLSFIPKEASYLPPSDRTEIIKRATGLDITDSACSRVFLQIYAVEPNLAEMLDPASFDDWIELLVNVPIEASLQELIRQRPRFLNVTTDSFECTVEVFMGIFMSSPHAEVVTFETLHTLYPEKMCRLDKLIVPSSIDIARSIVNKCAGSNSATREIMFRKIPVGFKEIERLDNRVPKKRSTLLQALIESDNLAIKKAYVNFLRNETLDYLNVSLHETGALGIEGSLRYPLYMAFTEDICKRMDIYPDDGEIETADDAEIRRLEPLDALSPQMFRLIYENTKRNFVNATKNGDQESINRIQKRAAGVIHAILHNNRVFVDEQHKRAMANEIIDIVSGFTASDFQISDDASIERIIYFGNPSRTLCDKVPAHRIVTVVERMTRATLQMLFGSVTNLEAFKHYSKTDLIQIRNAIRARIPKILNAPWIGNSVT